MRSMDAFETFLLHADPAGTHALNVDRLCDYVLRLHETNEQPDRQYLIARMTQAGLSAGMQNHVLSCIEFGRALLARHAQVHEV